MKEQNKKKKRKIFLSLIMILFVGVILTASTYTWFTSNKQVTVDSLDVNVSTSTGLQISTNAIDWKTIITRDDIVGASTSGYTTAVNQVPSGQTNPVSTAGELDGSTGHLNMFRGTLADQGEGMLKLTAVKSTEKNGTEGDFIAFDLFFNTSEAQDIYLTSGSNVIGGSADGAGTDTSIQNAARVAFVPQGNNPEASNSSASQGLTATDTTDMKIWEPNADIHTANGVNNAQSNYGKSGLSASEGNATVEYYGIKAAIGGEKAQDVDSTDPTYFTKIDAATQGLFSTPKSGIPTSAYQQILHLERGVTKVRIYMWVEGQDVDCEDYASGGDLTFNLQFSSLSAQA